MVVHRDAVVCFGDVEIDGDGAVTNVFEFSHAFASGDNFSFAGAERSSTFTDEFPEITYPEMLRNLNPEG